MGWTVDGARIGAGVVGWCGSVGVRLVCRPVGRCGLFMREFYRILRNKKNTDGRFSQKRVHIMQLTIVK